MGVDSGEEALLLPRKTS